MASDIDKCNFGDSARNSACVTARKGSNHVFDGAGENVHYYSDSDSVASRKSKTRYINSAIYVEQVEASQSVTSLLSGPSCVDVTPHPHSSYRSNSTPFLSGRASSSSSIKRKSCRLEELDHHQDDETPREDRTYREGQDTFRLSVASVSTTTTAKEERERNEAKKRQVFEQWLARKEKEKREKARLEKMKRQPAPTTTTEQREESYRRWLERKRTQTERRKAQEIVHKFKNAERQAEERNMRERAKEEKLAEWIRRKEEDMKLMKTREERRAARLAIEEKRKRAEGERAYRDWLRTSRNKPLPVPLNQGELSMRGSVSKMYINPIPWQSPT
ncbi:vicilin-like seed storage protein At2g18540 [Leguminivora glycinivorella]|uniref:vicilin-like seed storage protein At2g18540 n=1 Tax=Leguminivora glycinivorella TaxID=1035111 RepID=UPI0020105115|nr:vicilin-like seed storage protein At2g18540 [Leguminivora glycinivorella]